ncbi:MAG: hypothetical protein KF745_10145 [Phycisphaeraceae bacterium]|nr:hypothetical protein [Phycisphaeraceae bacterium]
MTRRTDPTPGVRGTGRWHALVVAGTLSLLAGTPSTIAQADAESEITSRGSPDAAVEGYLDRLGLRELLASQLSDRLRQTGGDERKKIADRLSAIYVELLTSAPTDEARRGFEAKARELLRLVPEADSYELRINLSRASYLHAEEIAERARLRLTTPEENSEADKTLRTARAEFLDVATKTHARVELLERQEQAGRESEQLSRELAEARRLRSLAFYFAGWTDYYLAFLSTGEPAVRQASDAMRSFGWLLNSRGGNTASLERVQPEMFKYEHIARAALGCALASGIRGNDVEAMRWLRALSEAPSLPPSVRDQLFLRRLSVLGEAKRWSDLDVEVRRERKSDRDGGGAGVIPLQAPAARLLAVLTLEADRRIVGDVLDRLSRIALADLTARGEIGQVLDLVQRYGTAPIGENGFIVNFVRGVQTYEQARSEHKEAAPTSAEEPCTVDAIVTKYKQAAALLEAGLRQPDAGAFGAERARAARYLGLSLFYAGEFQAAADRFLEASRDSSLRDDAEESMWLAISALDRAARLGAVGAATRRDEAAALFLQTYGDSDRSARLLNALGTSGIISEEAAIRILLGVPRSSPSYDTSRRQAARLLYAAYRAAAADTRDFAAVRFLSVAEELLAAEKRAAFEAPDADKAAAAEKVVTRARQILDASLSTGTVDAARAAAAFDAIEEVSDRSSVDLAPTKAELLYRRMQLALRTGDPAQARATLQSLREAGGPYAEAGDRLLYLEAVRAWRRDPADGDARESVIELGSRIIDVLGAPEKALKEPGALALYATVAEAAAAEFAESGETSARSLAIRLDREILQVEPRAEGPLRRLAVSAEATGDSTTALECWITLAAGLKPASDPWFEARYNTIRLLLTVDPAKGGDAFRQHKALYPELAPDPWRSRFQALQARIPPPAAPVGETP